MGKKYKTLEKDVNLAVALHLKKLLERELNVKVLLTRADDRFVSLYERTKFANDNAADIFVSIHSNASVNTSSKGIEVYYLSTVTTTESRAVEALENSVVNSMRVGKVQLKNMMTWPSFSPTFSRQNTWKQATILPPMPSSTWWQEPRDMTGE